MALFSLENIGKSPSRFDFAKLNHLNKHYIKLTPNEDLLPMINNYLTHKISNNSEKFIKIIDFSKEKIDVIPQLAKICEIFQDGYRAKISAEDADIVNNKKEILLKLYNLFSQQNVWQHDQIKQSITDFTTINQLKIKDFGIALRIALTFSSSSAGGIFDVIELLGKNEALARIKLVV